MSQSTFDATEANQHEVLGIKSSWIEGVLRDIKRSQQRKRQVKPSIYRVPQVLRLRNPHADEPKLVSVGPYHHGNPSLQAMEEVKWHILSDLSEDDIRSSLEKMQDLEAKARSYYSEVINMESCRFVEMLLLDGYFIIQLFHPYEKMAKELHDLLKNSIYLEVSLLQDLLLLENQLPYFILNDLLSFLNIPEEARVDIRSEIATRFCRILPGFFRFSSLMELIEDFEMAHLLHLLHNSNAPPPGPQSPPNQESVLVTRAYGAPILGVEQVIFPSGPRSGPQSPQQARSRSRGPLSPQFPQRLSSRSRCPSSPQVLVGVPSVTELVEAGVKIKVSKADNFLDISFNKKKGLLEIPAIHVHDSTNLIFRNLIALEQCHTDVGMKITYYSTFMDSIINTERDVALLSQEGIIVRALGSDADIALLFNELCKGVVFDVNKNYLAQLFVEVNVYCNSRWNRWRARLMHDYFSNPWAIISVIAAAVLLVLTIVQTLASVLSYTQQINSSDRPHP